MRAILGAAYLVLLDSGQITATAGAEQIFPEKFVASCRFAPRDRCGGLV